MLLWEYSWIVKCAKNIAFCPFEFFANPVVYVAPYEIGHRFTKSYYGYIGGHFSRYRRICRGEILFATQADPKVGMGEWLDRKWTFLVDPCAAGGGTTDRARFVWHDFFSIADNFGLDVFVRVALGDWGPDLRFVGAIFGHVAGLRSGLGFLRGLWHR